MMSDEEKKGRSDLDRLESATGDFLDRYMNK